MMMRAFIVALALVAAPAIAQTARVTSGDHDGFSRLVVELPTASDWQLGRTSDGYGLAVTTPPEGYDLSGVFDLIRRNRLAAISIDAETGNLEFGLACACHAIPFEFRPGVIVIDVRDGAPPAGSSFELPLAETSAAAVQAPPVGDTIAEAPAVQTETNVSPFVSDETLPEQPPTEPTVAPEIPPRWVFSAAPALAGALPDEPPPKDDVRQWLALDAAANNAAQRNLHATPRQFFPPNAPLAALRDDLLMQISRGAARGIVDIASPALRTAETLASPATAPFPQVAINPLPGVSSEGVDDADPALTGQGATCIADERVNVAEWGRPGAVADEIATLTSGIVGEFDAVNPEALAAAVKYSLFLGFGVEAANLVDVFPSIDLAEEAPIWTSIGRLIDGYPDAEGAFADMQTCDTAAALWAVLAVNSLTASSEINTQAVLRSFSALPVHLRLSVGPDLAERFLEIGDDAVVQAIRDAIQRAPEGAGAAVDLMSARLNLAENNPEGAEVLAEGIIANAGPNVAEAMLALVEASLAQAKPIDPQTTNALEALVREHQGAPLEPALARALILALASNGDADAAFALLPKNPENEAELWSTLAELGTESDLLAHAVRPAEDLPTDVLTETRLRIAERLMKLGFAQSTLQWLGPPSAGDDPKSTMLYARAALQLGDPGAALHQLATLSDPASMAISAAAELQRGDAKVAAELYGDLQDTAAQEHARIRARDWAALAVTGSDLWKDGAARLWPDTADTADASPLGPLAEASALLTDAAQTRASVTELLSSVASPVAGAPAQKP